MTTRALASDNLENSHSVSGRTLLTFAWQRHNIYSKNASKCRSRFFFLRNLMLILSVLVILLSVLKIDPVDPVAEVPISAGSGLFASELMQMSIGFLLICLPIIITALLAFSVKFDRGNNWLLLRGNAEAIKKEIYCYRTRIREYKENRDEVLAQKIKLISERLKGSTVHQSAFRPYEDERTSTYKLGWVLQGVVSVYRMLARSAAWVWVRLFDIQKQPDQKVTQDDKLSDLNADQYLDYRLADQFIWYRQKTQQLDKQLQLLEAGIYIFGGLGTFLAAIDQFSFVAITVAMTGALSNYRDYRRVESTLIGYNQAADALYDVHTWWTALSPRQKQKSENFELLVSSTEEIIRSEHVSWLQDMQDQLAEIYGSTESDSDSLDPESVDANPVDNGLTQGSS
ncbi:MAG: DUF4231 domain-containing protein [Cyanobacteria bacterium P01_G01_bin.38]